MNAVQQPLVINVEVAGFVPTTITLEPSLATPVRYKRKVMPACEAQMHRVNLQDFMFKQAGKFVSVTFRKLDGSIRVLTGRLGVQKHLKGGVNTVAGADRPYLVVFDVQAKGYRAVNLETVTSVRAQHVNYTILG